MESSSTWRGALAAALVSFALLGSAVPAAAADSAPTAQLTGTVKSAAGSPVAGAHVTANGPAVASTVTDRTGAFTLNLVPGVYSISVEGGGFQPASLTDVAVVAGTSQPLTIVMTATDLSSLRTIGRVTTSGRAGASTINTGAASSTYVSGQVFANLGNPQVNDILQRIPDVTVQKMGSQQDTSIVVGGLQPYETQVLMDGHPLALGQYGVWLSHLFPSYLVGGIETQTGPGNTTPFANIAVGGTVNILTPGFTARPTAEFTTGIDSYSSQYSNLLATGSAGNLQYVVAAATAGSNGPYFKKKACAVTEDYADGAANSSNSVGIVQFCGDMSGSLYTKGELLKMRYNFTPSTSFEFGFVGSFGGYSPQGSAWGNALGPTLIEGCMSSFASGYCTNPADAGLIGKTITGYSWYPGTIVTNTQQIWTGQFRTSIGDNTLLVRPYLGAIQPESYDGTQEGGFPSFFSPPGTTSVLAPGQQIPPGFTDPTASPPTGANSWEQSFCPTGTIYSYSQLNSPKNTVVTAGNQELCFQYPYTFYEQDKLYGTTFSLIHPFGENFLEFTYDFHGQSTFAYANTPSNVTVPNSANRYSTFSLTGSVHPTQKLSVDFGLYNTTWTITGEKAEVDAMGNPVLNPDGSPVITGLFRSVNRTDPHIALVDRAGRDDSFRLAWGTSETFPFIGDVSGTAAYQPFAQSAPLYTLGIFTEKAPNLAPEFSQAWDLGFDHRFHSGGVLSMDLQDTTVHNVFQQLTLAENTTFNGNTGILGIFTPINVATLHSQVAILKYAYQPAFGLGYGFSAAADRSILSGIPNAAYNGNPGFPVNNVQLCGNGLFTPGLATCIPYLKAYGHVDYVWHGGSFASLGVDYEGKNNAYYQPPFAQLDLTARRPLTRTLELQVSVQNLLNTNNFSNLAAPGLGVPVVAENSTGLTRYSSDLIPTPPRTVRGQLRWHVGGR
jgi:outer membrane cobalamin receptor